MKSFLVAAAVLAASPSWAAPQPAPAAASASASAKADLVAQIDAWAGTELPQTQPADQLTLRYKPRLDDIRSRAQEARAAKDLERARKDFEEWKTSLLHEKFAAAPRQSGGFTAFSGAESERARMTAVMSAMMRQERSRQSVMLAASRAPAAADGTKFFDGGVAVSPAAEAAAPAGFAGAATGAARYEKVRRLLISQGVDPKIVDAGIAEGIRQQVDPMIVLSVVWKESDFNRRAHNDGSDARGLMQMVPDTAREMGVSNAGMLYDIRTNLRAGVRYMKWIANDYFHMNVNLSDVTRVPKAALDTILASYNAGIGNVGHWLRRQGGRLQRIPFHETRDYVKRISDKIASWTWL